MLIKEYIYSALQGVYPQEELKSLAQLINKDLLNLSEADTYIGKYINLSAEKKQFLENILQRLKQHEPIQYITGKAYFHGYPFTVTPGVLIPRPETEELVELILDNIPANNIRILDIGTGSGCIAISLSKKITGAVVEAWDISEEALKIARQNNDALHANVSFQHTDILSYQPGDDKYDIIVSNPPYITEKEKSSMHQNVLNWEPGQALFVPDSDPLMFYRKIAETGTKLLIDGGSIYFEINQQYGKETSQMLEDLNYRDIRLIKDLYGNDRMITARYERDYR